MNIREQINKEIQAKKTKPIEIDKETESSSQEFFGRQYTSIDLELMCIDAQFSQKAKSQENEEIQPSDINEELNSEMTK